MFRCSRQGKENRIQHGGLLGEDFFAGKALVRREGIAEMDIAKEIFALEDGDGRRTSKRKLCNIRRHIPHYTVYTIKKSGAIQTVDGFSG